MRPGGLVGFHRSVTIGAQKKKRVPADISPKQEPFLCHGSAMNERQINQIPQAAFWDTVGQYGNFPQWQFPTLRG